MSCVLCPVSNESTQGVKVLFLLGSQREDRVDRQLEKQVKLRMLNSIKKSVSDSCFRLERSGGSTRIW